VGELDRRLPRSAIVRDNLAFEVRCGLRGEMRREALESLLDWNSLRRSLKSMGRKWSAAGKVQPLKRDFNPDGTILYPRWEKQKAEGTYDLDRLIQDDMEIYPGRYEAQRIDRRRVQWLEEMVQMAEGQGAQVVCFTTPLHPKLDTYVRQTSNYAGLLEQVRQALADLASVHRNMAWVDCSTIDKFGGRADWYWDGAHPAVENTRLIVDKCLEALPDAVQ